MIRQLSIGIVCGLALLFSSTVAVEDSTSPPFLTMSVEEAFKDNGVVSDVIDVAPKSWLQVSKCHSNQFKLLKWRMSFKG
jgi:hypothetical protein